MPPVDRMHKAHVASLRSSVIAARAASSSSQRGDLRLGGRVVDHHRLGCRALRMAQHARRGSAASREAAVDRNDDVDHVAPVPPSPEAPGDAAQAPRAAQDPVTALAQRVPGSRRAMSSASIIAVERSRRRPSGAALGRFDIESPKTCVHAAAALRSRTRRGSSLRGCCVVRIGKGSLQVLGFSR